MKTIITFMTLTTMFFSKNLNLQGFQEGLYYGQYRFMLSTCGVFAQVQKEITMVEIYQPFKGQIIKIGADTLYQEKNDSSNFIFNGKLTCLIMQKDMVSLRNISNENKLNFKELELVFDPSKVDILNEYRIRSYLFEQRYKVIGELEDSLGKNILIPGLYNKMLGEKNILDEYRNKSYEEFLNAFILIRSNVVRSVIEEVRKRKK